MPHELPDKITVTLSTQDNKDLQKRDDAKFQTEIKQLTKDAERIRLRFMKQHKKRRTVLFVITLLCITGSALGFGWFFLMKSQLIAGLAILIACCAPLIFPYIWAARPPKLYRKAFKAEFLPQLAQAFGGLRYFQARGISEKIVQRTGLIPSYTNYKAEDCFAGQYKGVKVILSEARLYHKKKKMPVFDGLFVLLEVPAGLIEGHTVITADMEKAARWRTTRWRKLKEVEPHIENPQDNRFKVFSSKPESAGLLIGERLLKELAEMADIFNHAPLSAALFKGKYIFIAVPCEEDMFEPSNMDVPVATTQHAIQCKREVEKLMEIIDIFELFNTTSDIKI